MRRIKHYKNESAFMQAVKMMMVKFMSREQIREYLNEFEYMDQDNTGMIEFNELLEAFRRMNNKI